MTKFALALGGIAAAWMTKPFVDMAVNGTIDDRTRAAWRRTTPGVEPVIAIPAQRSTGLDDRISA